MDKFIDGIGAIRISNGLVRIQTTRRIEGENGEQRVQERGDLILPIASFLNLHRGLVGAVEQMLEQGILTRKSDDTENIEATGSAESLEANIADETTNKK